MSVPREKWQWYGHAGHFICGYLCRFHLCTLVGDYLVSTVGEMWPPRSSREIHADIHDKPWFEANRHRLGDDFDAAYMERFGYDEIGYGRKYETMVFTAGEPCAEKGCNCGLPRLGNASELDAAAANTAGHARLNHLRLCAKWAKQPQGVKP